MEIFARFRYCYPMLLFLSGVYSSNFILTNNCDHAVWPGVLSNADSAELSSTGFLLEKGQSWTLPAPSHWSGRFWGRTQCANDSSDRFSCATGDCNSGGVECDGNGAAPPATLAEFTLAGGSGLDFYDVSVVDGYNLRMEVVPQGGSGNCAVTGCVVDLNAACPADLRVRSADGSENVGCRSACEAFRRPQYCCSGEYANPTTCKPTSYSQFFKRACPRAYSYAYDDGTSTYTCASADYVIIFCPKLSSKKSTEERPSKPEAVPAPLVNASMLTGTEVHSGEGRRPPNSPPSFLAVSILCAVLLLRPF